MKQTQAEFLKSQELQKKQKIDDEDTMKKAAEAVEKDQIKQDVSNNMTKISVILCFSDLTINKWNENKNDNDFLLRTFLIKWVGIDPTKLVIKPINAENTKLLCPAVAQVAAKEDITTPASSTLLLIQEGSRRNRLRSRGGLQSRKGLPDGKKDKKKDQTTTNVVGFEAIIEMPTDRQEDVNSVKKAINKMHINNTPEGEGAEINIALNTMLKELGSSSCSTKLESEKYTQLEGTTPPELRTNVTKLKNATSSGNLNELTKIINAKDTPEISEAIEAQKLEAAATDTSSGPLKILPDQAIQGPSYPGAFGTDLYEQQAKNK
jgi:hypothetical protein